MLQVSPTRFERGTFGSGGRNLDSVNPSGDRELREPPHPVVPSLVPTSPGARVDADSSAAADSDLAQIIAAWPGLPEAIKAGILALVKAAGGPDG